MKKLTVNAKHFYEWLLSNPTVDYRAESGVEYIAYYNGGDIKYHDYKINNVTYWCFEENHYTEIDIFKDRIELYIKGDVETISISNISTEVLDEELFQLSTLYDISIFEPEDLKYFIKSSQLLSD